MKVVKLNQDVVAGEENYEYTEKKEEQDVVEEYIYDENEEENFDDDGTIAEDYDDQNHD